MLQVNSVILADDRPADLPTAEDIVQQCRAAGYDVRGIPVIDQSCGVASAWVKYGPLTTVTMGEARTQDHVGRALNGKYDAVRVPRVYHAFECDGFGYIIMEHINGSICDDSDALQVAAALECLISVQGPTTAPGPVGGGRITHIFFIEWESSVTYDTVQVLEDHVNGVRTCSSFGRLADSRARQILANMGHSNRVSFEEEVRDGLRLCPCDIHCTNFMKDLQGKIVALDFGATCFLPPSFFAFAMAARLDRFTWLVAQHIKYPASTNLDSMLAASYYLVPFGTNNIGEQLSLSSHTD
jgi:hypothetical protein